MTDTVLAPAARPAAKHSSARLALADGTIFEGTGFGAAGQAVGEVCFNTAMTGYQEILTDPSYAGQIVAFTFPHIGIVGANSEDIESLTPVVRGLVVRADAEHPSNWRALSQLDRWLKTHNIPGIAGIDRPDRRNQVDVARSDPCEGRQDTYPTPGSKARQVVLDIRTLRIDQDPGRGRREHRL